MALECTSIEALEVTGSDYPGVNGIYYPFEDAGGEMGIGDIWAKNDVNDTIRIVNPGGSGWAIAQTGLGPSNAPLFTLSGSTSCPALGQYNVGAFGEGFIAPIVSEYILTPSPSQPTFGLPADVVALITSRHGSVANYLRLRNQGQI